MGDVEYMNCLKTEGRAEKTLSKYRRTLKRLELIATSTRKTLVNQINLRLVDAHRKQRKDEGCAAKTIYGETFIIRQLINFALSRKMLQTDTLKGQKNPAPKRTEQPCWTEIEVEQILSAAQDPQKSIYTIDADTGMRFANCNG